MSLYSSIVDHPQDGEAFLEKLPLFAMLDSEQLDEIAGRMQRRSFAPGVTLYHQDMPGIMLYIIEKGCVRIFSMGRTGQELTLAICGTYDIFGELSLLDHKHHSATAITLLPTVVWLLSHTDLEDLLKRYPVVAQAMIQLLVARVRDVTHHVEAMTFQDVQGRLAYELLKLAERFGRRSETGIEVNIPLTQGDLATIIGATRESVNKSLSTLRAENLVQVEGVYLTILDSVGLQRMVHERGR
jgi:CRP/FNR family cyclic AMP-dependent transcriptional regulator